MANPVLANIGKLGARLYYLGNRTGLEGWLIVKDGQIQIAYALPNAKQALIGALFGPDGQNITADQIQTLMTMNKEVNALLTSNTYQQQANAAAAADIAAQAQTMLPGQAAMTQPAGRRLRACCRRAKG